MQQLIEFAGNHAILVAAFFGTLAVLAYTEIARRRVTFKTLDSNQAVAYINGEDVHILDLSSSADFAKGHIVEAENLALSRIKDPGPELSALLNQSLLLTCKNGQISTQAAALLTKQGAQKVAVLRGGVEQWASDNFPLTRK